MEAVAVKTKKEGPRMEYLKDGTVCYTKPVRYPSVVLKRLKKIWYENDFKNMSEVIFYCIEEHEKNELLTKDKHIIKKENVKSLTVRFRERHYKYILKVCETKGLDKFTDGVIYVLYEYLNIKGE